MLKKLSLALAAISMMSVSTASFAAGATSQIEVIFNGKIIDSGTCKFTVRGQSSSAVVNLGTIFANKAERGNAIPLEFKVVDCNSGIMSVSAGTNTVVTGNKIRSSDSTSSNVYASFYTTDTLGAAVDQNMWDLLGTTTPLSNNNSWIATVRMEADATEQPTAGTLTGVLNFTLTYQ